MMWGISAAVAGAFFVFTIVFSLFGDRKPFGRGIIVFLLCLFLNVGLIYAFLPQFSYAFVNGYPVLIISDWIIMIGLLFIGSSDDDDVMTAAIAATVVGVILFVLWLVISLMFISPGLSDKGRDRLADLISLEESETVFPDTDVSNLIRVAPETAMLKASRAMGGNANLGSYLKPNRAYLQQVNGHWYYVVDFSVTNWRGYRTQGGVVPGYIVVDAMDPDKEAELRLGYQMKYVPDARWNLDLERYVYLNFVLGTQWRVDDLTGLEVDDQWNPFYTGTLLRHKVGFTGKIVDGIITLNPQTGEIVRYELDKAPNWINRIWSQDLVSQYLSWWGEFKYWDFWKFQGSAGQRKIDKVNDVVTSQGLEFQATMTSVGPDQSLSEIIYINPRTGKATRYKVASSTVQAVDNLIDEASRKISAEGYEPVEVELHYILGRPVWYGILTGRGAGNAESSGSYAGVAFVQARYSSDSTKVVMDNTLQGAYDQLRRQIAMESKDDTAISKSQIMVQFEGVVVRKIRWDAKVDASYFLFEIKEKESGQLRRFQVSANDPAGSWMREGDVVTVTAYKESVGKEFIAVIDIVIEGGPVFDK